MCCGEQRRKKRESLTTVWPILGASTRGSPLRTQQICGARRGSPNGLGLNVAIERDLMTGDESVSGPNIPRIQLPKRRHGGLVTMMPTRGQFAAE
jgi:hypothetical protein